MPRFKLRFWFCLVLLLTWPDSVAFAAELASIQDTYMSLPSYDTFIRVFLLKDYNTRVVMFGTMALGLAAGVTGTMMLLRKRALMGDALSHATLPGIGLAFIFMIQFGGTGKYLPGLLLGAGLSGAIGLACIMTIRRWTRLKEDAALGIVLSVFFGLGIAILGIIQKMQTGHASGLQSFIYGKTAAMLASDAQMIALVAIITVVICGLLFKELKLLCFDQLYARSQGWPILRLDAIIMALVIVVTVIGLQAVGLILMIALLVIPPAAARFWTDGLFPMTLIAAGIGAASGFTGAALSALLPRLPAGAIIVVVASVIFALSLFFGTARGIVHRLIDHMLLSRKIAQQNLLRALYERSEKTGLQPQLGISTTSSTTSTSFKRLLATRSWSPQHLRRIIRRAVNKQLVRPNRHHYYSLTGRGLANARRVVRNHRLWELYLIHHADIAPSHVDRGADELEHIIGPSMVDELLGLLAIKHPELAMPPSPHATTRAGKPHTPPGISKHT